MLILSYAIFYAQQQLIDFNEEVLSQNRVIEEKQKEILNSIRYAKGIQQALLPSEKYIERNMEQLSKKD